MKRNYIKPQTHITPITPASHLLTESAAGSITIDREQTVSAGLAKENNAAYNVWDDDWSQ